MAKAETHDDEFTTVQEESPTRVIFDTHGDSIRGEFLGRDTVTPQDGEPFDQLLLRGDDGTVYSLTPGYKLDQAFGKVSPGQYVRVTYVKDIDTGQPSPMKDFRVEVRKG